VHRDVARRVAHLRRRYCICPVDALQVATALIHGAEVFVTNDRTLKYLHGELDILMLDDLFPPSEINGS
jgi:predicted nucleic acid-binding protein